jgi:uncharacterized protein YprB with RNaseH-like and TPR domain
MIEEYVPGFWQDTSAGKVFVLERRYELDYLHGNYPLGSLLEVPSETIARIGQDNRLEGVNHPDIVYLDTETTGLGRGAGTLAFLVGVGRFLDGHFCLRQYFLDSLDREQALLRALSDCLRPCAAVVTFNGKVFDLPLLETRYIQAQLPDGIRHLAHLDLLLAARRLYRGRFDSYRLGVIERRVLGLQRLNDVPSPEVPSLYFRYMRNHRFRALLPVFQHNALDILSLVTLSAHLGGLYEGRIPLDLEDEVAIARICEREGRLAESICRYERALDHDLPPIKREDCERRLSLLFKRTGRHEDAAEIWRRLADRLDNRSVFPHLELARYYERRHDLAAAIHHATEALALQQRHHLRLGATGAPAQQMRLQCRLARLRQRLPRRPLVSLAG